MWGEVLWQVPPLSVPAKRSAEPDGGYTVEGLMGYEAVRLFVDRTRLRLPSFRLTGENAGAVARVCRKLDGIPLAIELATARMGALAVEQVAQRLDASLDVLKGTGRSAAPRQQTLRATLDWSHDLLSEVERALFRRLSVFAGGWTLEAAEAGCSRGVIEQEDVLDLLGGLVDKSLVVARASEGGAVRYRMLEPVRQYALEKLEEIGEADEVKGRHAEFFLKRAEEAEPELEGMEQGIWMDRLQAEHDNIRAALSWALGRGEAELGLRIAGALWTFWEARGYFGEGRKWLEAALAKDGQASTTARAKALDAVGWLALDQGDLERADTAANEGLELSRAAELGGSVAAGFLRLLEMGAWMRGDYAQTKELAERSLALSREAGDRKGMAWTLTSLAWVASGQGDGERALELSAESLALSRELGGAEPLGSMLLNSGYEFLVQGDQERATALIDEAAALYRKHGNKDKLRYVLLGVGWIALMRGGHNQAEDSFKESLVLSQEMGDKRTAAESLEGLACIFELRGEAERAARLFGAVEALREAVSYYQPLSQRVLREPYLSNARSRLGEALWQTAFAEGQAMGLKDAIEYAQSKAESARPGQPSTVAQPPNLTRREREVAALLARKLTNRQIAQELVVSERTVETHVRNLLKKLGLKSREQVAPVTERPLDAP